MLARFWWASELVAPLCAPVLTRLRRLPPEVREVLLEVLFEQLAAVGAVEVKEKVEVRRG